MAKTRSWAIKLGSGGRCVPYCEERGIVGVGWSMVDADVLTGASYEDLREHVGQVCGFYGGASRLVSAATGSLWRFARECAVGDVIAYYDPARKDAVFTRVTSRPRFRDAGDTSEADIWHYREVQPLRRVPILDLHGSLKGRLLGPRMSFWELRPSDLVEDVAMGRDPGDRAAPAKEIRVAWDRLVDLVLLRARALDQRDWELVVVDFFRAQGAQVDESRVGGNRPVIDAEATFDWGPLGSETWRIQVKRYEDRAVDWPEIAADRARAGEPDRFCYVSVFGFTPAARATAEAEDVDLLEAEDFAWLFLSNRLRESLRTKVGTPGLLP